jgi:UDP-N-acetylmuramate dehydrogenase
LEFSLNIRENVSLAPFTTLNVGGPARYFIKAETEDDVVSAFKFARDRALPVFVLGGGSNIVVADAGFDGVVLQIGLKGRQTGNTENEITVAAGEDWDTFVEYAVMNGFAGVECLSGIPGSVGGTPVQNVGAYGQEVSETITCVRCLDRSSGEIKELTNAECAFSYRRSVFNSTHRDRHAVLSVTFALRRGGKPRIVYRDLIDHFEEHQPTLSETREAILSIRRAKSMVIDAKDPNSRSVGSFFKNPIVEPSKYRAIEVEHSTVVPGFPAGDGIKIPAAWLIERTGFYKGYVEGNVGISTNHTLALINRGGGTAEEIIHLKEKIQAAVRSRFEIDLEPEPVFVGKIPAKK